jgi:hypothetical protein
VPPGASFLTPLRTRSGYFAVGAGETAGDPQVTFDAAALGLPVPRQARQAFRLGVVLQGWLSTLSPVEVITSFDAIAADLACGVVPRRKSMAHQVASWLRQAAGPARGYQSLGAVEPATDALGQVCWLAKLYGVPVQVSQRSVLRARLRRALRSAADQRQADASELGSLVSDASDCRVSPGRALHTAVLRAAAGASVDTSLQAFGLAVIGHALHDPGLVARGRAIFAGLRRGAGYMASTASQEPDVLSTSYGYSLLPRRHRRADQRAAALFASQWGPVLQVVPKGSAVEPDVDVISLSLGLWLAEGSSAPQPVI